MFEQAKAQGSRNAITDWVLRGGIAFAFVLFETEKFPSGPDGQWVKFFADVGVGQWFRYATGVVELLGAALVLIPWTVNAGLALLACTMAGAAFIHIFVLHHPFNAPIPLVILTGLVVFLLSRRNR